MFVVVVEAGEGTETVVEGPVEDPAAAEGHERESK